MNEWIELLRQNDELLVIDEPVDTVLEAGHIAYAQMKKPNGGKAVLFTNLFNSKLNIKYDTPTLANIFGSTKRCELLFGRHPEEIAAQIEKLLHLRPPESFFGKLGMLGELASLRGVFPKTVKSGRCQDRIFDPLATDLLKILPAWTTWSDDGGPFVTMGQVYTKSLDGQMKNVGMYRLQIYEDSTVGMHWQIHKDSNHFFHEYRKVGKKMPVAVAVGGDPLLTWCATAPAPLGVFELMFYGLIRRKAAKLVNCKTVDLQVPSDADFIIEGWVDPEELRMEGPFGDHTGYYTPKEPYPLLRPTCVTAAKDPVYYSTVVGKPPIEDKYMGWATERIFLPLLRTTNPDLLDYSMPENGVFHNLVIAKLRALYPSHAKQAMHALWGIGQMSFVKHAIFVGEDAPSLENRVELASYICNHLDTRSLLLSYGVADALDHSGERFAEGGKLGLDCTATELNLRSLDNVSDDILLEKMRTLCSQTVWLKQYCFDTVTPITVVGVEKNRSCRHIFDAVTDISRHARVVVIVDSCDNDKDNGYMLLWRVCNNFDSARDFYRKDDFVLLDGTRKNLQLDGYDRLWPADVVCDRDILFGLKERGLIDLTDDEIGFFGLI